MAGGKLSGFVRRYIAAYIRVSSPSQDHAYQRAAIERAALARGAPVVEWFAEKETGKRLKRPELDRLRSAVREGEVSQVWVWRLDRLTRSGIRDTLGVIDEFRRNGVELVSVADQFALDGPAAEVVLAVLAWAAQTERRKIEENLVAARKRVETEGGKWGRPRRVSPELEKRIHTMHEKMTIRAISVALKIPRGTVSDVLSGKGPYRRSA